MTPQLMKWTGNLTTWAAAWIAGITVAGSLCSLQGCKSHESKNDDSAMMEKQSSMMTVNQVASDADKVGPLNIASMVPSTRVKTLSGESVDLKEQLADSKTALIFFRGGWCPYCTKHLSQIQGILPQIKAAGYDIVAVAPDSVANLSQAGDKHNLDYTLLADENFEATKAFGLGFYLDQDTITKYKGYNIPLYSPPGDDGKVLPVPAVFLVDQGRITYRHYDPDYRSRLSAEELLKAINAE